MIAVWNIFIFAILVLVLIGFALTKLPGWWPPSRRTRLARRTEAVRLALAIERSIKRPPGQPAIPMPLTTFSAERP